MNKTTIGILIAIVAVVLIGSGVYLATNNQDNKTPQNNENNTTSSVEPKTSEVATETDSKKEDVASMAKKTEEMNKNSEDKTTSSETVTTPEKQAVKSAYITLADYEANMDKYKGAKIVHFFHADWCSVCVGLDAELKAGVAQLPENTIVIKTDYDTQSRLKQRYGVTTQTTFVQIDDNRDAVKKWTAASLSGVVGGIQ